MADPLNEAFLAGNLDEHEQVSVTNGTGAELAPNEVWFRANASGVYVAHVARETIAAAAVGEALIRGEISAAKRTTAVFNTDDDVYWATGHNEAVTRALAKTGDYYLGECTQNAASGKTRVRLVLNGRKAAGAIPSVSSSISASSSSVSVNVSVSSNSDSSSSRSISSNSDSSEA